MHTPAPWIIDDCVPGREIGYRAIVAGDTDGREAGEIICHPSPMGEANARLIAAAPDMLAVLVGIERSMGWIADNPDEPLIMSRSDFDDVRAAIARATGGDQ